MHGRVCSEGPCCSFGLLLCGAAHPTAMKCVWPIVLLRSALSNFLTPPFLWWRGVVIAAGTVSVVVIQGGRTVRSSPTTVKGLPGRVPRSLPIDSPSSLGDTRTSRELHLGPDGPDFRASCSPLFSGITTSVRSRSRDSAWLRRAGEPGRSAVPQPCSRERKILRPARVLAGRHRPRESSLLVRR